MKITEDLKGIFRKGNFDFIFSSIIEHCNLTNKLSAQWEIENDFFEARLSVEDVEGTSSSFTILTSTLDFLPSLTFAMDPTSAQAISTEFFTISPNNVNHRP